MKRVAAIIISSLLCFSILSILAPQTKAVSTLPWKDDFNYETEEEMEAAGWTLSDEERIAVGGGVVTLDNDGVAGCGIKYSGHFPSGVNDFTVEAKSKWIGRAYGQRIFYVWTQRHRYGWYGDGYYPEYSFIRYSDGWGGADEKVLRFGGYAPVINEWTTFALEKRGSTFYMYENGVLKNTYTETDSTPDELVAVSISGGWISTVEYDYMSVTGLQAFRAWKDESSFGLENNHLLLHGDYNTYGGKIWFDYLVFKDTATTWTSPWDDIFCLYSPRIYGADWSSVNIEALNYGDKAMLTYSCDVPSCPWPCPPVHCELTISITDDSYIHWTAQVTNIGSTTEQVPISLTLYTFIAGDTANDHYIVSGHPEGVFTGTQENLYYKPTESWAAVWDSVKGEGCGIINTEGFNDLQVAISDWYHLTAVPEMASFQEINAITLAPGETSRTYDCYYYFYQGTGWQQAKDFYDALVGQPDFEISVSPNEQTIGKDDHTDYQINIISMNSFDSLISFEASSTPSSDLDFIFYPSEVTLAPDGVAQSLLIVSSTLSTTATTYLVTVTASGAGRTHSNQILLIVTTAAIPTELTITKLMVTTPDGERVVSNAIKSDVSSDVTAQGYLKIRDTKLGVPNAPIILEIGNLLSETATTRLGGQFSYTFEDVILPAGSYALVASFTVDSTFKGSRDVRTIVSSPDAKGYTVYVGVYPDWSANYGVVAMYNENGETIDMKGTAGPWPFLTQFFVWGAPPDGSYLFVADVVYNGFNGIDALATDSKIVWIDHDGVQVSLFPKLAPPHLVVQALSPIDLFVTDPLGRSIGTDPMSGENISEVPSAVYTGHSTVPQLIIIPEPIEGTYGILLVGTATGDYTLTLEYITSEQTTTQTFMGTVSQHEQRYYSAQLSETGEMTAISWEHVFKDPRRGTILKISTDDRHFQFLAPEKDFGIKHDVNMAVFDHIIIVCYEDEEMRLIATVVDSRLDFTVVIAWDKQTGRTYWLINRPKWPLRYDRISP